MKRSGPPKRKKKLQAKKGLSSTPKRMGPAPKVELPPLPKLHSRAKISSTENGSFRYAVLLKNHGRCVWPKCRRAATDPHHVVYKRHIPEGHDKWDARDGVPLCHQHHWVQHYGGFNGKLPMSALLPENLEFAREVLGQQTDDYLLRHYATDEEFATRQAITRPPR